MAPNGSGRTATPSSSRHGRSRSKGGVAPPGPPAGSVRVSVDTTHPIDRDVLDHQLVSDQRLNPAGVQLVELFDRFGYRLLSQACVHVHDPPFEEVADSYTTCRVERRRPPEQR